MNPWAMAIGTVLKRGGAAAQAFGGSTQPGDPLDLSALQSGGGEDANSEIPGVQGKKRLSEIEAAPIGGNLQTELPQGDEDVIMRKKAALNSLSQGA